MQPRVAMNPKGKLKRVVIDPSDEKRLHGALERWAAGGDFVPLRTRAFLLLLWDGSVRTSGALAMNVEDVVRDPGARRVSVLKRVVQPARDENGHRQRSFVVSARAQQAIADYVRAVRYGGWLPTDWLEGPLFLSSVQPGSGQRLSMRNAIHWWETFQRDHTRDCSRTYTLDDLVYTGRLAYVAAADGNIASLAEHSGISRRSAAEYRLGSNLTPEDVMAKLDRRR
jgi:integrase